jgi:linalool 8-monooxygenase
MAERDGPSTLRRRSFGRPDVSNDLKNPDLHIRADLADVYHALRTEAPVRWNSEAGGPGFWAVLGYDEVSEVLKQPALFSADFRRGGMRMFNVQEVSACPRPHLLSLDPPDHTAFRRELRTLFEAPAVEAELSRIRCRAATLVGAVAAKGAADFVAEVALPYTVGLLTDMLDVPAADGMNLAEWGNIMMGDDDPELQLPPQERRQKIENFDSYFLALLNRDAASGADGILARLRGIRFDGGQIDTDTVLVNAAAFLIAASETTRHALSSMVEAFTAFPEERQKLLADRSLIPSAVKEILRWSTPLKHVRRTATADTVLGGETITAGDKVIVWYDAANRDPLIWHDAERFHVERYETRGCPAHLTFGVGVHHCLGWRFGEAQIAVMLTELLDRLPDIRVEEGAARLRSNFVAGFKRLPVIFTPA